MQVAGEPVEDCLESHQSVCRRARAGQLMRLGWEADELDLALQKSQDREQILGVPDWTAKVVFGVQDQERSCDLFGIRCRRDLEVHLRSLEPVRSDIA